MIVELKDKLKPNSFLFWDGKKIVPISHDELLNDVMKRVQKLEEFHQSVTTQQDKFEKKLEGRFKEFLNIFRRGDK